MMTSYLLKFDAIKAIMQVGFEFGHVKGHQDCRGKPKAPIFKLNIECDWHATALLSHAWCNPSIDNPQLLSTYPHIIIHGKPIVHDTPPLCAMQPIPQFTKYISNKNSAGQMLFVIGQS